MTVSKYILAFAIFNMAHICTYGSITVSKGGYNDIVFGIDKNSNINKATCKQLIAGIKGMMEKASFGLNEATNGRLYFHNIAIGVPSSWNENNCGQQISPTTLKFSDTNVVVGNTHPLFGEVPWTEQPRHCRRKGEYIYVTEKFLKQPESEDEIKGRMFLHEWSKFRYGVFEEYGHPKDPIYPEQYLAKDGTTQDTMCSADAEQDTSLCNVWDLKCRHGFFRTASIMSTPLDPKVIHYCNFVNHNRNIATKQNNLCNRRTTKNIIDLHRDFRNKRGAFWLVRNLNIEVQKMNYTQNTDDASEYNLEDLNISDDELLQLASLIEDYDDLEVMDDYNENTLSFDELNRPKTVDYFNEMQATEDEDIDDLFVLEDFLEKTVKMEVKAPSDDVKAVVWTSINPMMMLYQINQAPVLFAMVQSKSNKNRVLNAKVTVGGLPNNQTIQLRDNGAGGDITGNDGIYSGHIVGNLGSEKYTLSISVSSNDSTVYTPTLTGNDAIKCCGSSLIFPESAAMQPVTFSTFTVQYPIFIRTPVNDDMIPGRVRDLVAVNSGEAKAKLKFSKPGDNLDQGDDVTRYIIYTSESDSDYWEKHATLSNFGDDVPAGDMLTVNLNGLKCPVVTSFLLFAVDKTGHMSDPSNEARVKVTCEKLSNSLSGGAIAGIIFGVIFGVLLIAMLVYLYMTYDDRNTNWLWEIVTCKICRPGSS